MFGLGSVFSGDSGNSTAGTVGGLLGSAVAGPVGGVLGTVAGNAYSNGAFSGLGSLGDYTGGSGQSFFDGNSAQGSSDDPMYNQQAAQTQLPADYADYQDWKDRQASGEYSIDDIQQGYADLLRADYDDWKTRFQPYEQQLADSLDNPMFRDNALGYATDGVNNAYQRAQAWQNLQNRKYGVELDATERASVDRRLGNTRQALLASGRTNMNQALNDREQQVTQGLLQFYNQDRAQALGQMGYLSGLANQREQTNDALNAAASQQQAQTWGSALGTFGSMALAGNPMTGLAMGGITLLGSLF